MGDRTVVTAVAVANRFPRAEVATQAATLAACLRTIAADLDAVAESAAVSEQSTARRQLRAAAIEALNAVEVVL